MRFEPTASGTLDAGWTGISHALPIFGTTLDLAISCPSETPPCGTCTIAGLMATRYPERCRNDSSRTCTVASEVADCGAPGTCTTFLSPPQSLGIGGLPLCYTTEIGGPVTGTVDVESGVFRPDVAVRTEVRVGVFEPETVEGGRIQGCARCVGDAVANDGVRGGTCDDGPRIGLACDTNAISPYADFGGASFDCPTDTEIAVAVTLRPLTAASVPQTLTLDAASLNCTGVSARCFCSTCNNAGGQPCASNADCPPSGGAPGICNGRRCLSGPNHGAPCSVASECPSGFCNRPGEPTRPNPCLDDTSTPNDCSPSGECTAGPFINACTNHPDRGCLTSAACDDVPNACLASPRRCFPDNGVPGGSVSVGGVSTPPVNGVADPTDLGAFTCVPPLGSQTALAAGGFPGLARTHLPGRLLFDGDDLSARAGGVPHLDRIGPLHAPAHRPDPGHEGSAAMAMEPRRRDHGSRARHAHDDRRLRPLSLRCLGRPGVSDPRRRHVSGEPCWQAKPTGFTYRNKDAAPDGIVQVDLRAGGDGKARAAVRGQGGMLSLPALTSLSSTITVQLRNRTTGFCLGTSFVPPFDRSTPELLKDRAD